MKVSLNEIKQIFDVLIEEQKPREQIASWGSIRQRAHDIDDLEFEPPNERKKIWRAITYLMGVDLKNVDGSYLHSIQDFIEFRGKNDL